MGTRFSIPVQTGLMLNGYRVFPGCKVRPESAADKSPLLVPRSRKSRAIPLPKLWATLASNRVYVTFYLFTGQYKMQTGL